MVSNFTYYQTIVLVKKNSYAYNLLYLSFFLSIIISIIIFFIIIIISQFNFEFIVKLNYIIYLVPLIIITFSSNESLKMFFIRQKKFKPIATSHVTLSIVTSIFSLAYGLIYKNAIGLILGLFFGQLFSIIFLVYKIKTLDEDKKLSKILIIALAKRFFSYAKFQTPSYFINNLTANLPAYFIARYFGLNILGNYYLADKIIRAPLGMFASSFSNVLLEKLASIKINDIKKELYKRTLFLFGLMAIIAIGYLLVGKYVFFILFEREEWELAFSLSLIIVIYIALQVPFGNFAIPFKILEDNKVYMYWEIIRFILVGATLFIFTSSSVNYYIGYYGIALITSYLVLVFLFNYRYKQIISKK